MQASARSTGTDADAIHLSRAGIPTGGVSIALRYMHSPVEMVQLDDIDACARLIAAFAQSLSAETSFAAADREPRRDSTRPRARAAAVRHRRHAAARAADAHRDAIHEALRVVHGVTDLPERGGMQTPGARIAEIARGCC